MFKPGRKKKRSGSLENVKSVNSTPDVNSELISMFLNLQEKLESPVFNGGFDRLFTKVEAIEASQKTTATVVENLNRLVYEPDEGLFSRIKKVEGVNLIELQKIAQAQEKFKEDLEEMKETLKEGVGNSKDFNDLKMKVTSLEAWRSDLGRKLWVLIPVVLTLLGKIGWDVIATHISLK